MGQSEHAVARAFDRKRDIAFAFEPAQAEQLTKAAFQIDVGELQLRFHVDTLLEIGEREGALDHAAVGLRLSDRHAQVAAAQVGGDSSAAELGGGHDDVRRRQTQVEINSGKALKGDAAIVPCTLIGGEQADGRNIGRQVERVGSKRALQYLPSIRGEGEATFGGVAVQLAIVPWSCD